MSTPETGDAPRLFDPYDVDVATIQSKGELIGLVTPRFTGVASDVTARCVQAQSEASGSVLYDLTGIEQPAVQRAGRLAQATTVGGGAVCRFSFAVDAFNDTVLALNNQILAEPKERRLDTYNSLQSTYQQAVGVLDVAARDAASALRNPEDSETVLALWEAGALPTSAVALFPNIDFSQVFGVLPYEVRTGTTEELVDYLHAHPELLDDPEVMAEVRDTDDDDAVVEDRPTRVPPTVGTSTVTSASTSRTCRRGWRGSE